MNLQDTKKLINNVIENEFRHIQETQEVIDLKEDKTLTEESNKAEELFKKLLKVMPEHKELLDEYYCSLTEFWSDYAKYYFMKGVRAGTTNLEFLKDTDIMEYI